MFRRILIANRGEIAVRVIRACRELGIETVAVHSGAEAVHPGYGSLAENPAFATACADARIVFIGPPAEAMERLGSKIAARRLAADIGIPVVPGVTPADQRDETVARAARRIGFPLLLKPAAGGGGIGMKTVHAEPSLAGAMAQARREAARNDLPQAGPLLVYRQPAMPGVRVDSGVCEGDDMPIHYDPFLIALLEHPRVVDGDLDTRLVDTEREVLLASVE